MRTPSQPARQRWLCLLISCWLTLGFQQSSQAQLVDRIRNFFRDPLIHAIDQGLKPDGDLAWELSQLDEVTIESTAHGEAILRAVASLSNQNAQATQSWNSVEYAVADLFLQVYDTDSPAYVMLWRRGIPELIAVYERLRQAYAKAERAGQYVAEERIDDLVLLLSVFAQYQTREGSDCVIQATRDGLGPDSYHWYGVFSNYTSAHPHTTRLFAEFRQQLPVDDIAESLADAANANAYEDEEFTHPFNTPIGLVRLKQWLSSADPMDLGRAQSAAFSLAYLDSPGLDVLLELAYQHRDAEIRLDAAYSAARMGHDSGFAQLVELCRNVHSSAQAQAYLIEVDRENLIPPEVKQPEFAALAEFSRWLKYENEQWVPPDELEVLDQRELEWLDGFEPTLMSIVRYRLQGSTPLDEEQNGVGLVGESISLVEDEELNQLSVEDIYAVYYVVDAIQASYIQTMEEDDLPTGDSEFSQSILQQWVEPPLDDLVLQGVLRINHHLNYPQPEVAVGQAQRHGELGFAVFDGPRSRWYPASQLPDKVRPQTVLRLHVGRQLLDFPADEQRAPRPLTTKRISPQQIVEVYETWLDELDRQPADARETQLQSYSDLDRHFEKYAQAKSELSSQAVDLVYVTTYERLFRATQSMEPRQRGKSLNAANLLGRKFERYATLLGQDQPQKLGELIRLLEPYWEDSFDLSLLASTAYAAGLREDALRILERQPAKIFESWHSGKDARILAELWHAAGRVDEARDRLARTIQDYRRELKLYGESETATELQEELVYLLQLYRQLFNQDP